MKILVVDDNKDITDMLSKFLKAKRFETVVTNDPWKGLKYIQHEQFDAILLDLTMPEFSGLQIIGMLATDDILKDQNIFIFSADLGCDNQIKDLLRKDGIKGCLKKPIVPSKILTAITGNDFPEGPLQTVSHVDTRIT